MHKHINMVDRTGGFYVQSGTARGDSAHLARKTTLHSGIFSGGVICEPGDHPAGHSRDGAKRTGAQKLWGRVPFGRDAHAGTGL